MIPWYVFRKSWKRGLCTVPLRTEFGASCRSSIIGASRYPKEKDVDQVHEVTTSLIGTCTIPPAFLSGH